MTHPSAARPSQGGGFQPPSVDLIQQIITQDNAVEIMITEAARIGLALQRANLTTSQVRIFFGTIRQIEANLQAQSTAQQLDERSNRRLILLIPRLAYQAKRNEESRKGVGVSELQKVLEPAIKAVQGRTDNFRRLVEFFEAILAYHKAAGGKEN
jgi:CRISPR-associated protein Csm2